MSKTKKLSWPQNWMADLKDACYMHDISLNDSCFPIMMRVLRTFPERAQNAILKHYRDGMTYTELVYDIPYKNAATQMIRSKRTPSIEMVRGLVMRYNKKMVDALVDELKT